MSQGNRHPTRLAIVRLLRDSEDGLSAGGFGRSCRGHGTLSSINYHFTELEKARVTSTEAAPGSPGWRRKLHRLTPAFGGLAVRLVDDIDAAESDADRRAILLATDGAGRLRRSADLLRPSRPDPPSFGGVIMCRCRG